MLLVESALKGYLVEADDGSIGSVHDCLFDDRNWKLRWLVVDTRMWLTGRKVLIHPSVFGRPDIDHLRLPVHLTKAQIGSSPEISFDLPVSEQMEKHIYGYYGWDPEWGGGGYFASYPALADGEAEVLDRPCSEYKTGLDGGDPNLRSMAAVNGYHVEATDGSIGHIESFILDDVTWDVRYLVVDTRNWWFGQHVLISPLAVRHINWTERNVRLNLTRDRVKNSPPWKPLDLIDKSYQERLHGYYAWPSYGR
ncbi:MAG: PRC-barrel domain-containing protein [Rhodopila sp.]|jgi:hypothetical protein